MASSRIFVNGLPPSITEGDFKKHFSGIGQITDAKVIPNRRIGFVGYRTPEEACKAVKHFNKTYIRMSRLRVELATPVQNSNVKRSSGANSEQIGEGKGKTRSQRQGPEDEDPKLKEFLDISISRGKKRARAGKEQDAAGGTDRTQENDGSRALAEHQSDDEYEDVPRKAKRAKQGPKDSSPDDGEVHQQSADLANEAEIVPEQTLAHTSTKDEAAVSDADWARSRTSRLLGLLDEDEDNEEDLHKDVADRATASPASDREPEKGETGKRQAAESQNSMPKPPSDNAEGRSPDVERVRSTMRLFVRNLPYDVKEEDLEVVFEPYGSLEEVSSRRFRFRFCDEHPDRDS